MKKIAALLALVLCLMAAGTAMAEPREVKGTYGLYGTSNSELKIMLFPFGEESFDNDFSSAPPSALDMRNALLDKMAEALGTNDFKYMLYDADPYTSDGKVLGYNERENVYPLSSTFNSAFFDGDTIKRAAAAYYDYNQGAKLYSVKNNGNSVQVEFEHLTPIIIAWVPELVAAPLEAPDMPSTGDSSSLPVLFILLGMSVAAMGAMKLRRREN